MARTFEEIVIDANRGGAYMYLSMASGVEKSVQQPFTLDRIIVGSASMAFQMYDNASGASGTLMFDFDSSPTPYTVLVGAKVLNGLTIPAHNINPGKITLVTRPT